ncbi:MAG: hypothetical protein HGA84_05470, partial [Syntrophobacteraceae bacterium]|nr:hypothetical protein [Syntrophobacteraceae bacterium]
MSKTRSDRIQEIVSSILANRRFIVTTHVRPDGDALGSLLAMVSSMSTACRLCLGDGVRPLILQMRAPKASAGRAA